MYRLTPKEEVSARVRALQRRLGRDGVDAAFFVQNADLFYFNGPLPQGVLLAPGGAVCALVRPLSGEEGGGRGEGAPRDPGGEGSSGNRGDAGVRKEVVRSS